MIYGRAVNLIDVFQINNNRGSTMEEYYNLWEEVQLKATSDKKVSKEGQRPLVSWVGITKKAFHILLLR